jgi:large subunit ribosomal protein L10
MPKTKVQKQNMVSDITDKLSKAKSLVFADYQGLTMSQLSAIRSELAAQSAEFTVTKNNLLKIALKNSNQSFDDAVLVGPIATLFAFGDEISPIKVLTKAIKDNNDVQIKGGVMEGEFLSEAKVKQLSELPSKDELRAQVVGTIAAPLYGLVNVMQGNLRNLVYALEAIRKQKGGE